MADAPRGHGATVRRCQVLCCLLCLAALLMVPHLAAAAGDAAGSTPDPDVAKIGVYIMDLKKFSVAEGTVEANFYLSIRSDRNISLADVEIVNGHILATDTIADAPGDKNYRILASLNVDPDLRLYPFDRHVLDLQIEPKVRDAQSLLLAIDGNRSGLDAGAETPGWQYTRTGAFVENYSYGPDEPPYSRAVFTTAIQRDTASTILKFFLPIMLIIIVSLSSLAMKVSSRLGLNASMFLAAVLIHWRIADAIPLVAYATFLDFFMIITYATLVMVLVSGILILRYTEAKDAARADAVYRWSIRLIPPLALVLYAILFAGILI